MSLASALSQANNIKTPHWLSATKILNQPKKIKTRPRELSPEEWVEALEAVSTFYILQMLSVEAKVAMNRHSHIRWKRDFLEYKEQYAEVLATNLFDYIVLICAGEARHSWRKIGWGLPDIPTPTPERHVVYRNIRRFDPKDILEKTHYLFKEFEWDGSFGGKPWAKIAQGGLKYWSLPTEVFIDHVVDIAHNNGTAFDKPAGIFKMYDHSDHTFKRFLDFKASCNSLSALLEWAYIKACRIDPQVLSLVKRANTLGITEVYPLFIKRAKPSEKTQNLFVRDPIIWGKEKLTKPIYNKDEHEYCRRRDEDYYGEDDEYRERRRDTFLADYTDFF